MGARLDDAASARMWALDDEKNPIAEKIMSLPVTSIAGLRAKVLVMLWEALPIWSNVGRLNSIRMTAGPRKRCSVRLRN